MTDTPKIVELNKRPERSFDAFGWRPQFMLWFDNAEDARTFYIWRKWATANGGSLTIADDAEMTLDGRSVMITGALQENFAEQNFGRVL